MSPCAPITGMTRRTVGHVMRYACERAGITPVGAHRLRHAAASELLRHGAGLAEIGQVLRHQNFATTAIYAKVDRLLGGLTRPSGIVVPLFLRIVQVLDEPVKRSVSTLIGPHASSASTRVSWRLRTALGHLVGK